MEGLSWEYGEVSGLVYKERKYTLPWNLLLSDSSVQIWMNAWAWMKIWKDREGWGHIWKPFGCKSDGKYERRRSQCKAKQEERGLWWRVGLGVVPTAKEGREPERTWTAELSVSASHKKWLRFFLVLMRDGPLLFLLLYILCFIIGAWPPRLGLPFILVFFSVLCVVLFGYYSEICPLKNL